MAILFFDIDAAFSTIGLLFQATIYWALLVLDWYFWQPLAACYSWDWDLRCSALITNLSSEAGTLLFVNIDLEKACPNTPGSTTELETLLYSGIYQSKGLKSQGILLLKPEGSLHPSIGLLDTWIIVGLED